MTNSGQETSEGTPLEIIVLWRIHPKENLNSFSAESDMNPYV